jgi:histidinol-phosphate/aromatic aminotransferase/cobyric acid decarboxylase-like protein
MGFCVASTKIINKLLPYKISFSVSSVAIESAIIALKDKEHLKRVRKFFKRENKFLSENLEKLGFKVLPVESNSILAKVNSLFSSATEFIKTINAKGATCVDGRHFNLPKFIRITPRDHKTNQKFIEIIAQTVQSKKGREKNK